MSKIDFDAINAKVIARLRELLPTWLPQGRFRGNEFIIGSIHGERGESCSTNVTTGITKDFATGQGYGDPIALYAAIHGLSMGDAARELNGDSVTSETVPRGTNGNGATNGETHWSEPIPAPLDATAPFKHYAHGNATNSWTYYLADHATGPAFFVCRYDLEGGKKVFAQYTWRHHPKKGWQWHGKSWPAPRPLYKLRELISRPDVPVVICEGEKAADAAALALPAHIAITWAGGCAGVKHADWAPLKSRHVTLWPDADKPGREAMAWLAGDLIKRGAASVAAIIIPEGKPEGWDAADATAAEIVALINTAKPINPPADNVIPITEGKTKRITRTQPQRANGAVMDGSGNVESDGSAFVWWQKLQLVDRNGFVGNGVPFPNESNLCKILEGHPAYRDRLYFDEFKVRVSWRDQADVMRAWTDKDSSTFLHWVQTVLSMPKVSTACVHRAVEMAAYRNPRHLLKEWLNSLEWDGTDRLESLCRDVFGTPETAYSKAVGKAWLISLVARAFKPGEKVDTMPVLEGLQGASKSKALEVLGGEWYLPLTQKFGSKQFVECLDGGWVVEIPDMSGLKSADVEEIKAAVTLPFDRYRSAYAHFAEDHLRQCVFAATANNTEWNEDRTGARRFLPLTVTAVNIADLKLNRDAYFAEAVHRYCKGETWWEIPDAAAEQAERRPDDPWEWKIWQRLKTNFVSFSSLNPQKKSDFALEVGDLLTDIGVPVAQQDKKAELRITAILKKLGWSKRQCRRNGHKGRFWYPPDLEGKWAADDEKSPT